MKKGKSATPLTCARNPFIFELRDSAEALVERLLFAAMIEARSCERFRVLSTNIEDKELAKFYHDLMLHP